jgi:hypothetical protein
MMQQVNLLTDELKPKRDPLTLQQLLSTWLALLGLLMLVSVWQGFGIWSLESAHAERQQALETLTADNDALRASVSTAPEPELIAEVAAMRERFSLQSLMVDAVTGYERGDAGFSGYLTDLAVNHVDGMALQRIELADGGSRITLSGETEAPVNVPVFLKRLSDGDSFSGHRFDQLRLEAQESGLLRFRIMGPAEERKG